MPEIKEILQEYVATANNPEYKSDFEVINSKFPELSQYDKGLLQEYVATANNPEYKSDFNVINSKFPELFTVKKKETTQVGGQTSKPGTSNISQSNYNLDLKLPSIPVNPNNKALEGLGKPFKPEIALKSAKDEQKFIAAKNPIQTNFTDYSTIINEGIKGQNRFDNTTQTLTSQNVIPQQAKKEVQQLQQKQQVLKDARKDTHQNILAVIPELADAKNTDEAISTILKSDMKNNLDYWQQFDDEALLGNDESTLNDFLVSKGLKNQDREAYLKEQASSNPKYGYEYEYNKIGSLFKAVKQRADDYDVVLKQKFGDNYMDIAKQGNADILNDADFNKFRQLREKQNELSTKANGLINDGKYAEVKKSRDDAERVQSKVDKAAKEDKWYNPDDELNYAANKLGYAAGHVVKMIAELPALATSIDKGYDWTDKLADWGNRFSDNLIESMPVSTDKKTGVFNKVADVDGYKVFVDANGEPIDVRDKNNFKVPLSVSQSVVEKFNSNPQSYKTRNEMSGALVDNGLNTMIDMGIMILGTKGAGMVGAGEKLQKLTTMGIAYQQTKRDVYNDAIKKGLDPRNADLLSNIIGVAAGTSSMINPMEFNIAKGAGLFNLLKTDGLNAAKLALIKDGKLSVKDYAKEFFSGAIKNTIGENIEELGIENTTQAISNNHFNNQISETDMVDGGLDDKLHILDKQGLETFLITAGSSFLMTPIEINSQTQFNQQEAMKMAIENPEDFAKIKELQLKQGQISQQQFDNETKIYNDVSKTYNAVKDDVKEELQPQLLALLTKKSNLTNKISEIKDEVLSKPYKDQLEQINKGIESISIGQNASESLVAPIEQSEILAESTAKDGSSTITKVETDIANKINKGQDLTAEETDYYNAQKDSIDKLVTVNKSTIQPINEVTEVKEEIVLPPPPPEIVAPAELDEQQITQQLNEVLNEKTTPTELTDTEQEINNSERLPSELENNQGVQQDNGIGQYVSNESEVPQIQQEQEVAPIVNTETKVVTPTATPEILDEIKSKNLTHVRGKNMGENQSLGTFISTEKGNRYETADNKAESVEVDIKNPLVVENDLGLVGKRTEILNNNKDQFTKEDTVDYQELPNGKITLDDLNDAGIKKLAKLTTEKLQADGYDGIYFKESKTQEGELVVFDKEKVKFKEQTSIADEKPKLKAKEKQDLVKSLNKEQVKEFIKLKTPQEKESYLINLRDKEQKLKNDKHDRLVSLMREYNSTPSNRTTRKQEIRQSMLKLSSDLGYSIKAKEGDKLEVLNSNGKLIRKINIPTDEKPATAENIEKVKELTHWFNWNGNDLDFHIDAVKLGLTWQNIRTALADINAGKTESTNINRVANAINEYGNMESLPLVRGFGGNYERLDVTGDDLFWAQKVNEATELLSGYEYNEAEREQALKDLSETDEKEFEQYSDLYSKFVNQDGTLNWEEALKYEQANKTTTDESAKGQGSSNIIGDGKNSQQLQKEKRSATEIKSELRIKEAELKKLEEKQSQLKKQLEQNLKENQLDLLQGAKPQAMFDDKVEQQKIAEKSKSDIENKRKEIAKLNEELDNINQIDLDFDNEKIEPKEDVKGNPINKIEDVGEKIGGAKKDLATELNNVTDKDIESQPLSKSFPEPNYKKLVDEGIITKDEAIFLKYLYDNIPAKPRKPYRVSSWVSKVQNAIDTFKGILGSETLRRELTNDGVTSKLGESYIKHKEILEAFGFPENEVNLGSYEITKDYTRGGYMITKGNYIIKDGFKSIQDAVIALKINNSITKDKTKETKFNIYQDNKKNILFIGKKGAKGVVRILEGIPQTIKEASIFLKENQEKLESIWSSMKNNPNERRETNRKRIGTDWRNGENISGEKFAQTFGFRGVEFGNWVNNKERQDSVNDAYDALMDMANLLNVSPSAISLNGELGFAFGARGSGKASAHYESGKVVINLTKTKGAGSLAHEWFHALDNYFSRSRGFKSDFITDSPRQKINRDGSKDLKVRPEVLNAFNELVKIINNSNLPKRSAELDKTRSQPYWSTTIEMGARAFENFIIEKLGKQNESNDYLANFKETGEWINDSGGDIDATKNYPYPLDTESETINNAFQELFDTIQEKKEGDKSILFSVSDSKFIEIPKESFDKLLDKLKKAFPNIKVFSDEKLFTEKLKKFNSKIDLTTTKGTIYGAKFPDGTIYLNPKELNANTPIHEFGHIWQSVFPNEFAKGISLLVQSPQGRELINEIRKNPAYKGKSITEIQAEALVTAIGNKGETIFNSNPTLYNKFKQWLNDLFAKIGDKLGIKNLSPDDKFDMFTKKVVGELLGGKVLDSKVGTEKSTEKTITFQGQNIKVKEINGGAEVVNGFYSPLEKIINETKFEKLPAKQWVDKFAKGEEAKWTGLTDWLGQQQGSVSKTDIQQFLKDNRIEIVEVVKGKGDKLWSEKWDESEKLGQTIYENGSGIDITKEGNEYLIGHNNQLEKTAASLFEAKKIAKDIFDEQGDRGETKFSQYQLEGEKSNYKEVLVTMPTERSKIAQRRSELAALDRERPLTESEQKEYDNLQQRWKKDEGVFKSSHFDEPNILVHLRMNTRTDAEGNKVLFLEEVQSDWGQKGKKEGFKDSEASKKEKLLYDLSGDYTAVRKGYGVWGDATKEQKQSELNRIKNRLETNNLTEDDLVKSLEKWGDRTLSPMEGTPEAPFVTDTNAWTKLGLKVALKEAVKQGADKIAWTTGEQQNERYDLSKQVDEIKVLPQYGGSKMTYAVEGIKNGERTAMHSANSLGELEGIIGKELTKKVADKGEYEGELSFSGLDLKVGGKGMKGFYGSPTENSLGIVGNVAKSLFKQEPKTIEIVQEAETWEVVADGEVIETFPSEKKAQRFVDEGDFSGYNISEDADIYSRAKGDYTDTSTQHSIDITPEMKAMVELGQPLFQFKPDELTKKVQELRDFELTDSEIRDYLLEAGNTKQQIDDALGVKEVEENKDEVKKELSDSKQRVAERIVLGNSTEVSDTNSNVGVKKRITDARRESLGLKPVELPKLITDKTGMAMAKNAVDNGLVDPIEIESDIVQHEFDPTYAKVSRFDLEVLKYRRLQLEQKESSLFKSKIEINEALSKNPDDVDLIAQQLLTQEHIKNNLEDMEQNTLASRIASNVFANLGHGLQTEYNLEGEIQLLIKKIKNNYGENLPEDVKKKLSELEAQNKELVAKNEQIIKRYNDDEALKTKDKFNEAVRKEVDKILKTKYIQKQRLKGKDLIASGVDKVASALGVRLMAEGNERPSLIQGLAEIAQGLIDEGAATISNVMDKLGDYISDKFGDKIKFDEYREDVAEAVENNLDKFSKSVKKSESIDDLTFLLKKKMKELVAKGIESRTEIIENIYEEVKKAYTDNEKQVDFDKRKISDLLSDYGKKKFLSDHPIDVKVRDIKRQLKLASAIEDVLVGNAPLKSGLIPDKISDTVRRMTSEVKDLMKKKGIETQTPEQKWKTALDAIKTRLQNEINDLEKQKEDGKRFPKKTIGIEYDKDANDLKEKRDALKLALDNIIGKEGQIKETIDEIKRIAKSDNATTITKSMVKSGLISDLIRDNLDTGVKPGELLEKVTSSLKDVLPDITEEQLQNAFLRKGDFKSESKTKTQLQKDLADLKSQLSTQKKIDDLKNGIATEIKKQGEKSDEVKKLQEDLADQKRKSLNEFANLSAIELQRLINITQNRINKGDFVTPKYIKAKFQSDLNWVKNNQQLENIKHELRMMESKALDEKKSTVMKALDIIDKWAIKTVFFGTYGYQVKLGLSALSSIIHKPFEDLLGGIIYNNTFKNIAKNAPIEGNTKNSAKSLKNYYKEIARVDKWLKSIWQIASKGETALDKQMDKMYSPNKFGDFDFKDKNKIQKIGEFISKTIGADHIPIIDLLTTDPHAMIKEPIKRATYESAYNAYMNWVADNIGSDAVNDPLVLQTVKNSAFLRAKSEIFMGNSLTENGTANPEGWTGFLSRLNDSIMASRTEAITEGNNAQYALSSLYKFFLPIVKVPTNIITRAIKGNPIILTRNIIKAINTNAKIENGDIKISNEEADAIIRDLKKGTITSAYWIAGFLLAGAVAGGFYNPFYSDEERKRRRGVAKSNEILLGQKKHSVTDLMIHGAEHTSQVTALMLGATFWLTMKHYNIDEKESLGYAIEVATAATLKATGEQHPIFNFASDFINATQSEQGLKRFGKDIARRFDVERMLKVNPADYYNNKLNPEKEGTSPQVNSVPVKSKPIVSRPIK